MAKTVELLPVTYEPDKLHMWADENFRRIVDAVASLKAADIGVGQTPINGIILWWGAAANVPTGWAICDGTNGTPDLRGKVPVGISTETEFNTLGKTGGQKAAPTSAHAHTADDNNAGGQVLGHSQNHEVVGAFHGHGSTTAENVQSLYYDTGAPAPTLFTPSGASRWINTVAFNGVAGGHTHPVQGANASHGHASHDNHSVAAHNHDITVQPAVASGNNLQPYLALHFIMRVS